jgi:tetratricopeptide (TPR) repeat protein
VPRVLVAGWVAFAWACVGASPSHAWLDSGQLAAAGHELGVMHPPGMPGLAALLRLATLVPFGTLGFRMALVSSAAAAVAVALVAALLERRQTAPLAIWGAVAWLLAGLTFVRHARVVEIYAPAAAAFVFVLWAFDPAAPAAQRLRLRLAGTFVATWAIWSFAELRMLLPPVLLGAWLVAARGRTAYARWAPLVVVIATACVLALPLASARDPWTDWGDPETMSRLVDHVLARSIRTAYADEMLPASVGLWIDGLAAALARLSEDLGPSGPALVAVALTWLWVRPQGDDRRVALALTWFVLGALVYAAGINPMGGVDRQTGLLLAPLAVLLVARVVTRTLQPWPRLRTAVLPVLFTILVVPAAIESVPDLATTRSWAPHAWTRSALAQLPPGALLLTQSDDLSAGVTAARVLEAARPDVVTAPGQHLHRREVVRRFGDAAAAIEAAADERSRIEAAVAGHPRAVALEHAFALVFADVAFAPEGGRLPLALAGPGAASAGGATPIAEVDAWLPRLPAPEDRRRLAVALAELARARVRTTADVFGAIEILQLSLDRVDPHHASAMVTLGSLLDRLGATPDAIAWTKRALELDPDRHVALLNLALYLSRDEATLAEAVAVAEHAVALRPWKEDARARLAQLQARLDGSQVLE